MFIVIWVSSSIACFSYDKIYDGKRDLSKQFSKYMRQNELPARIRWITLKSLALKCWALHKDTKVR